MTQTQLQLRRAVSSLSQAAALLSQVAATNARSATLLARAGAKLADAVNDIAFDAFSAKTTGDDEETLDIGADENLTVSTVEHSLETAPDFEVRMTKALAKIPVGQSIRIEEMARLMGLSINQFRSQSQNAGKEAKRLGTGLDGLFYSRVYVMEDEKPDARKVREYAITEAGRTAVEAASRAESN